jgi:hypothetical protein
MVEGETRRRVHAVLCCALMVCVRVHAALSATTATSLRRPPSIFPSRAFVARRRVPAARTCGRARCCCCVRPSRRACACACRAALWQPRNGVAAKDGGPRGHDQQARQHAARRPVPKRHGKGLRHVAVHKARGLRAWVGGWVGTDGRGRRARVCGCGCVGECVAWRGVVARAGARPATHRCHEYDDLVQALRQHLALEVLREAVSGGWGRGRGRGRGQRRCGRRSAHSGGDSGDG